MRLASAHCQNSINCRLMDRYGLDSMGEEVELRESSKVQLSQGRFMQTYCNRLDLEGRDDGSTSGSRIMIGKKKQGRTPPKKQIKIKSTTRTTTNTIGETKMLQWLVSCWFVRWLVSGLLWLLSAFDWSESLVEWDRDWFVSRLSNGRDCVSIVIVLSRMCSFTLVARPSLLTNVESFA